MPHGSEKMSDKRKIVITCIAIAFTVFQLYTEARPTVPFPPFLHRAIHLAFGLTLIYLAFPAVKGKYGKWWLALDVLFIAMVLLTTGRHIFTKGWWEMIPRIDVANPSTFNMALAIMFILVCFEAARRTIGKPLIILALAFAAYAFFGRYVPGVLAHPGLSVKTFVIENFMTEQGTFGMSIDLTSGLIFAVVAFGAFMLDLGGGDLMIKTAVAIAGRYRGGPAKAAIVGSAFFGTVSGSAVANVATVGMFTIPMMKRLGYRPEFAGGVEACASTGGMIMPPVMGISAFVMVEFLGVPYSRIMLAALIPALFYFATMFVQVHFEAAKRDLKPMPPEEIPRLRDVPKIDWIMLAPLAVFVYFIAVRQLSVNTSAFYGSVSIWICYIIRELVTKRRVDFKRLLFSFQSPAKAMLSILGAMVILGNVVYTVEVTGLGTKLSMALLELAGGNVFLLLGLTMIASLVLGMGLPALACYIFLAILAAPALIQMGISPLAAHMFVFYFGQISAITPPLALASFVAAGIAETDPMKVGVQGTKLGIAGYIIPFAFALSPALLMEGSAMEITRTVVALIASVVGLAIAVEGYMESKVSIPLRIVAALSSGALVTTQIWLNAIGLGLLGLIIASQLAARRKVGLVPGRAP